MRARGRSKSHRLLAGLSALVLIAAACGDDDDATDGTLGAIAGSGTGVPNASVLGSGTGVPGTTVAPENAGAGFVSISVQVASNGVSETISLDRSTVAASSLDPVSLDATCTPLDGGDPAANIVSVVDLRRLAGDRLVSAELRYGDAAPGEHEMTLELGGADQVTTSYTGTVTVDEGGMSGSFSGADAGGAPVTGSFACASEAIATTTAPPLDTGEQVPDGSAGDDATVSTTVP